MNADQFFVAVVVTVALAAIATLVYNSDQIKTKCEAAGGTEIQGRCLIVKEIKP